MRILSSNGERSSVRHCLFRVDDQMVEDLLHLPCIECNGMQVAGQIEFCYDIRAVSIALTVSRANEAVAHAFYGISTRGKGGQTLAEVACHRANLFSIVQPADRLIAGRQRHFCNADIADDSAEQVIKVVSDATGQDPDRLKIPGLQGYLFHFLAFSDVPYIFNDSDYLPVRLFKRGRCYNTGDSDAALARFFRFEFHPSITAQNLFQGTVRGLTQVSGWDDLIALFTDSFVVVPAQQ